MDTATLQPFIQMIAPYIDWTLALGCAFVTAFVFLFVKVANTYVKVGIPIVSGIVISLVSQLPAFPAHISLVVGACSGLAGAMGTAYAFQMLKKASGNPGNP
jgi:hypothetical protein